MQEVTSRDYELGQDISVQQARNGYIVNQFSGKILDIKARESLLRCSEIISLNCCGSWSRICWRSLIAFWAKLWRSKYSGSAFRPRPDAWISCATSLQYLSKLLVRRRVSCVCSNVASIKDNISSTFFLERAGRLAVSMMTNALKSSTLICTPPVNMLELVSYWEYGLIS